MIELMEERLENTTQSPAELRKRASELREEAQRTDITGVRDAALAIASAMSRSRPHGPPPSDQPFAFVSRRNSLATSF